MVNGRMDGTECYVWMSLDKLLAFGIAMSQPIAPTGGTPFDAVHCFLPVILLRNLSNGNIA